MPVCVHLADVERLVETKHTSRAKRTGARRCRLNGELADERWKRPELSRGTTVL